MEVFRIGLVDCPCVLFRIVPGGALKTEGVPDFIQELSPLSVLDHPRMEPYNKEVFQIKPTNSVVFLHNAIIPTRQDSQCLPYAGLYKKLEIETRLFVHPGLAQFINLAFTVKLIVLVLIYMISQPYVGGIQCMSTSFIMI